MAIVIGDLRAILGLDSTSFQQGMRNAQKSLAETGQKMQRVGRTLSLAITAPLSGFAGLSVKTAADFQTSMNRVAAVSGATGDELAKLAKQARDLGASTQFSASEAADAMGFLAMAGFKTNEILGAMPDTLRLASAAQMDMASAADIVSNIMAGYSMKVEDLAHANDVLVKSFTSSNTDLRQLGEAMKYAGPVASAAGVRFEEAAAALGMMGNAGIQGSMAGTSLRGAISRILSPTKAMTATMQEAGLSFTDASGRIKPLADIIQELEPHADDAGLMMDLFGQRAGPAMAALVSQGSQALRDMTAELDASGGTAERVSRVQMEGFNGALKELRSAFEELQIRIAESGLMEWAESAVKWLTELVKKISEIDPVTLKWATAIAGVAAVLGPLLVTIGLAVTALGAMAAAISAISVPVAAAIAALTALAVAIGVVVAKWDNMKAKLADQYSIREGSLLDKARQWWRGGEDAAEGLAGGMNAGADAVAAAGANLGDTAAQAARDALDIQSPSRVMAEVGRFVAEGLGVGIAANANAPVSAMRDMADQSILAMDGFKNDFKSLVSSVIDGTKTLPQAIGDMLKSIADKFLSSGVDQLFGALFGGFGRGVRGGDALSNALRAAIPAFANGGTIARSGWATINERGGELVKLPGGSTVVPHDLSKRAMAGAANSNHSLNLSIDLSGANGDAAIEAAVNRGVASALAAYDRTLPDRVQMISANPRRR